MSTINYRGGDFLLEQCGTAQIVTPETIAVQDRKIADVANAFSRNEVLPTSERIDEMEKGLLRALLVRAADKGLFKVQMPESYGGKGLSQVVSALIAENLAHQGSFAVSQMSHSGIAMLPLLCYGTEAQKDRYLSKAASGEMILAYSLTEPNAGTDAMAVRTTAHPSEDAKYYVLNGKKAFCTNGGIADLFTIFAKIEGQKGLTAFLVEKCTPGLNIGNEDNKMGILGSSTTPIVLKNVKVPASNLLGEQGRGHIIAYNVLNAGRLRLAASCVGQMKHVVEKCVSRAKKRIQFGRPIAEFEMIRHKIARMAVLTYITESLVYRAAGCIDGALDKGTMDVPKALAEFSIEAAMAKVYGSEALFEVADEAVQLFGGYGCVRGCFVESLFRDCRIARIFEGTNEILRLFTAGELIKRAVSGQLQLLDRFKKIQTGLMPESKDVDGSVPLADLIRQVEALKCLAIYVAGAAANKFGEGLKERQSILATIADLAIEAYALDSAVARAKAAYNIREEQKAVSYGLICRAYVADRIPHIIADARKALANVAGGDRAEFAQYDASVSRMIELSAIDTDKIFDQLAKEILEQVAI